MLRNIIFFVKISKLTSFKQLRFFAMRTQKILFKSMILKNSTYTLYLVIKGGNMKYRLQDGDDVKEVLRAAYDVKLDVSGGWGYDEDSATIIGKDNQTPKNQLEYMLASMRANLEMNITQPKESRFGGINVSEVKREIVGELEKVTYEVSAIKESDYAFFIQEYKDNFEKSDFDMEEHFKRRKEATIRREITYFFKLS